MWVILFVVILLVIIIIGLRSKTKSNVSSNATKSNHSRSISTCISNEDIRYQIDSNTQQLLNNVERSKKAIQDAIKEANGVVNATWMNSYEKVLKISTNLDKNLSYQTNRYLDHSKFQYYTSLHFRSMIAANIVYKEYKAIDQNFNDINKLIVDIAKGLRKPQTQKKQIYAAKDSLKALRSAYLNEVHSMNKNTAVLRDKIGKECGQRGKLWRDKIIKNRIKR